MSEPKINSVIFHIPKDIFVKPYAELKFDDGSEEELDYFPDEISFTEAELTGLTMKEARTLKGNKDRAFLLL